MSTIRQIKVYVTAVAVCALLAGVATAGQVVVPNYGESHWGNTAHRWAPVGNLRAMGLFSSSEFQSLPGPVLITGVRLRPSPYYQTSPASFASPQLEYYMSTTTRTVTTLSTTFADNIGADNRLVAAYDASDVFSTAGQPSPPDLGLFDFVFPFATPFRYDPNAGNLLLDLQVPAGSFLVSGTSFLTDGIMDTSPLAVVRGVVGLVGSSVGSIDLGSPIHQFEYQEIAVYDFSGDDMLTVDDLNLLLAVGPVAPGVAVTPGVTEQFDLTGDALIDITDVDRWLWGAAAFNGFASPYKRGDANLNGAVDGSDFGLWNAGKFTSTLLWNGGDFNGDGVADGSDFGLWNAHKFTSSDVASAVPEPVAFALVFVGAILWGIGNRCRHI